jgi:HK97 family phage major capsid protein
MYEAMQRKQGFRFEIPAIETKGLAGQVGLKAAVSDTGLGGPPYSPTPTGLPAVIQPGLSMPIRLEPDRFWAHLPGIAVDAPAIEYIAHTSDGANPAVVAELATATDVGMTFVPKVLTSTKIAAMGSASVETLQDYSYFAQWIPSELSRLMINEETNYVVDGGTSGGPTGFGGILSFSGTLTRAVGPDTPLDAIQKAFNDLRVGSAYATADLVAMHPTTWNAIRRQKSSFNSYLLNPNPETGIVDTICGATVIVNTWFPIGTAIVLDSNQSLLAWTRSSLVVEGNPYGDGWDSFYWQYRAFERIGLGMRWPTAICIVTGLPTS